MSDGNKNNVEDILRDSLGKELRISSVMPVAGGCINNAVKVESSEGIFFIKTNSPELLSMFESEAKGLDLLARAGALRVPEVLAFGYNDQCSYLVQEFVEKEIPGKNFWKNFGTALSMLHRQTKSEYGLHFNNFIGALPQQNEPCKEWLDFFITRRLQVQINKGLETGSLDKESAKKFDTLFKKLPELLISEKPALLHGDLWSGNFLVAGQVCLIDPAVYYGHREAEIAFTRLFGGFDKEFYQAYEENFPISPGFDERAEIYNLYPLLVHVNLFGGSYLNQVKQILRKFM
ncbi:MAG: fructosamine kinase family protein [Cytophagaceae bacterium]